MHYPSTPSALKRHLLLVLTLVLSNVLFGIGCNPSQSGTRGRAQYELGLRFYEGDGIPQDYQKAMQWFRKAAAQGNFDAQYSIGLMYQSGNGVTQNVAEAIQWFRKGGEQGHVLSEVALGLCYFDAGGGEANDAEALRWFEKAAADGNAAGEFYLGLCYLRGVGVKRDLSQATGWFTKSAEQGDPNAQCNLGLILAKESSPTNLTTAAGWFRKAAEQGQSEAQYRLGSLYEKGGAIPKDPVEAFKWFSLAAKGGHLFAKGALAELRKAMSPEQIIAGEKALATAVMDQEKRGSPSQ